MGSSPYARNSSPHRAFSFPESVSIQVNPAESDPSDAHLQFVLPDLCTRDRAGWLYTLVTWYTRLLKSSPLPRTSPGIGRLQRTQAPAIGIAAAVRQ